MAKARLGSTYEALSGRLGNAVAANQQDGTELRAHNPVSKQPFSDLQVAREASFTKANQTWTTIGLASAESWRDWGRKQRVRNELTGKFRTRQGKDCFTGLFAKMLQVDPNAAIPTPPVGTFAPTTFTFGLNPHPGAYEITANGTNAAGQTCEFLVKALPSAVALAGTEGYRTAQFKTFTTASPLTTIDLDPGWYELAVQWVEVGTGRVAGYHRLGRLTVGLSVVQGGEDDAAGEGLARAA